MPVHDTARRGFASAAEAYERSRPGYPPEAIAWLADAAGIGPGSTVVDLAAGTGKPTRALVATGARLVAIEPVAPMRDLLAGLVPEATVLDGTAEAIPLPDSSADVVTVAQAFHWFDGPAALAEIHRVLRPGGALALVWNVRDLSHPIQRAVEEILAPHRGSTPSHRSGRWCAALEATSLFTPLSRAELPNVDRLDAAGLAERVASTSFIAGLPAREREAVLERTRSLAGALPERFDFPYTTEIEVLRRAGLRPLTLRPPGERGGT